MRISDWSSDVCSSDLYALVKYDYSQALEIVHREGATGLRRIVEAFVGNRSAIQKSAVIRTRAGIAEPALSTRDRMGRPAPELTDFFRDYLQITRERNDQELTRDVKEIVRPTKRRVRKTCVRTSRYR